MHWGGHRGTLRRQCNFSSRLHNSHFCKRAELHIPSINCHNQVNDTSHDQLQAGHMGQQVPAKTANRRPQHMPFTSATTCLPWPMQKGYYAKRESHYYKSTMRNQRSGGTRHFGSDLHIKHLYFQVPRRCHHFHSLGGIITYLCDHLQVLMRPLNRLWCVYTQLQIMNIHVLAITYLCTYLCTYLSDHPTVSCTVLCAHE